MTTVTADMIKLFEGTEDECDTSYPCQHGPYKVELKDGRKVSTLISSVDIYSILNALTRIGIFHNDWSHFSEFKDLGEMGWTIRTAEDVLTEIFNNK